MDENQSTTNALQEKAIHDLNINFEHLSQSIKEGFLGVHSRQDTTNGRISTNEKDLLLLREKFKYNRIVWYLFTTLVGLTVALTSYILYHH